MISRKIGLGEVGKRMKGSPRIGALLLALALALPALGAGGGRGQRAADSGGGGGGGGGKGRAELRQLGDQIEEAQRNGDLRLAEDLARSRIPIAERGPPRLLANAYRSLGRILSRRGKFADAEVMLRRAQPLLEAEFGKDANLAIRGLFALGGVLTMQGRYAEAGSLLRDALARQVAVRLNEPETIQAYNLLANVERQLGRLEEAEDLLHKADAVVVNSVDGRRRRDDALIANSLHAGTKYLLGRVSLQQGKNEQALKYAEAASAAIASAGGDDRPEIINSLILAGTANLQLGRLDAAEATLRRALALAERRLGRDHRVAGQAAMFLGLVLAQAGRGAEAGPLLSRATEGARAAGALDHVANFERMTGRFLVKRNQLADALPHYRLALDAVDLLFAQTQGLDEATRENFVARFTPFYYETLQLLTRLHQSQPSGAYDREALAVASRTQSRIFTELLRQADVGKLAGDAQFKELRSRQLTLKSSLAEARRALVVAGRDEAPGDDEEDPAPKSGPPSDPLVKARIDARRAKIAEQQAGLARELGQVEAQLWDRYPRYLELTQPRPVTVELLQGKLLKPGETLLSYFLLPESVLIFLVNRDDFRMLQAPYRRQDIAAWVAAARQPEEAAAGSFDALGRLDPEILNKLYRALFAPVESRLKKGQRLLVVGDGPVHTLPLEMLVTRYGDEEQRAFAARRAQAGGETLGEYAGLSYLGQDYRFAYLPSLSALASVRLYAKARTNFAEELVSFADPVFDRAGPASAAARSIDASLRGLRQGTGVSIPRLPETADEAREIATILGGRSQMFLGERAQEHLAKTLDLRRTRYLHFATHGLLGGEFVAVREALAAVARDDDAGAASGGGQRNLVVAAGQAANQQAQQFDDALGDDSGHAAPPRRELGQPALVLALSGDMQGEDGLLTMGEVIASMDLNAQLVVLSACNTAGEGAEADNGEGFAGLTRAFMYAGAQGLLVSHWSVESRSTQELMTEAFRRLHAGADNLTALEAARKLILGSPLPGEKLSRAHPYFWAPFVYVGD